MQFSKTKTNNDTSVVLKTFSLITIYASHNPLRERERETDGGRETKFPCSFIEEKNKGVPIRGPRGNRKNT